MIGMHLITNNQPFAILGETSNIFMWYNFFEVFISSACTSDSTRICYSVNFLCIVYTTG